ncbi:hypothetical protein GCM10009022_13550 [Vreelandella titanicae]
MAFEHRIAFPMADMAPFFRFGGTLFNAYPVWNFAQSRMLGQSALIAPLAW